MITSLILAEFDLNLGAIVNIQYPQPLTEYDEEYGHYQKPRKLHAH